MLLIERLYSTTYAYTSYIGSDAFDVQLDEMWMFLMMVATAIFMAWFGVESIVKANAFEIGAFVGTSAFLIVRQTSDYVCYLNNSSNLEQDKLDCGTPGLSIPAIHSLFIATTLCNVAELILSAVMVPDLRWTKYKAIGSDNSIRGLYKKYELFSSVRKMDLQFSVLLVISGMVFFSHKTRDQETGLAPTLLLAVTEVVWDRVGVHAIKRGDEWTLFMFWALSLVLPVYVSSVALVSLDNSNQYFDDIRQGQDGSARPDRLVKIAVLAISCVLNRISTVVTSFLLYRHFGTDRYRALQRVFRLGFKKYGVQRLGGGAGTELTAMAGKNSGSDTINPLEAVTSQGAVLAPIGRSRAAGLSPPVAAGDSSAHVSATAQQRLAAMYARQQQRSTGSEDGDSSSDEERPQLSFSAVSPVVGRHRGSTSSSRPSVTFDAESGDAKAGSAIAMASAQSLCGDGEGGGSCSSPRASSVQERPAARKSDTAATLAKHREYLQNLRTNVVGIDT